MTVKSIRSLFVAGIAAASLMAFSAPVYAATAEQSTAQAGQQGWCEIVPTFCGKHCGDNARCAPAPCTVTLTADRARTDQGVCVANRE